ncbi:hypothetical protein [Psychrobacillus sp. MER TA 171]|uniref:hypothetical protein n=1 Tax=Psychrobacillus sp. MER TA 171 TaxID=2939577 RepID=UPI002042363D|nr:hypothetical protein [Psychrobacillus sp. MER TA 171]MCM3360296.1 hypothetical protein [Psychrobacillus sp. MER TA 171]
MWNKVKSIYNQIIKYTLAIFLILFFFYMLLVLIVQGIEGKLDPLNFISVVAVALSFPGIVQTLADEVNPKKKTYKLTCKCPKCKHLIQMDMKEE